VYILELPKKACSTERKGKTSMATRTIQEAQAQLMNLIHRLAPGERIGILICFVVITGLAVRVTRPLWPDRILITQASDLANHVRHIEEYSRALAEGQWIPLVAPNLNDSIRIPLFQYYTGTGYTIPGILTRLGLDPYKAMKWSIGILSLLGGLAMFGIGRIVTGRLFPSLIGAVAFQLFPFAGVDLYNRGAYPEWAAFQWMSVVLYMALLLVVVRSAWGRSFMALASALAWAFFIPIHPSHALYGGPLIFLLACVYALSRPHSKEAVLRLVISSCSGVVLAAWFWLPIALERKGLRIGGHLCFLNAFIDWPILLSPKFMASPELTNWAPQAGVLFWVCALIAVCTPPWPMRLTWLSGLLFLVLLGVIVKGPEVPWISFLFKGLQWNYRLLMPCGLLGAVCIAHVISRLTENIPYRVARVLFQIAVLAYIGIATRPYFNASSMFVPQHPYGDLAGEVKSPAYISSNSSYYAFKGMEVRKLGWVAEDRLITGRELAVPLDAVPITFEITLFPSAGLECPQWFVNGKPRQLHCEKLEDGALRFSGTITPRIGYDSPPADATLRFEMAEQRDPRVSDLRFCAGDGIWFRPLYNSSFAARGAGGVLDAEVQKAGYYQIPVLYTPRLAIRVNGEGVRHSSDDHFMLIVPLLAGHNAVQITHQWPVYWIASCTVLIFFGFAIFSFSRVRNYIFGDSVPRGD
jgi:hypothetical protein